MAESYRRFSCRRLQRKLGSRDDRRLDGAASGVPFLLGGHVQGGGGARGFLPGCDEEELGLDGEEGKAGRVPAIEGIFHAAMLRPGALGVCAAADLAAGRGLVALQLAEEAVELVGEALAVGVVEGRGAAGALA